MPQSLSKAEFQAAIEDAEYLHSIGEINIELLDWLVEELAKRVKN